MAHVLVIDDTIEVRSVVICSLTAFGFTTSEANSGDEGIAVALRVKPDVIICDLQMPGMDGFSTLSAVREHPAIANVPFIFLTGSQERRDFRRGMVHGADDFITKPFNPEDLVEAVHSRIARHGELRQAMQRDAARLSNKVVQMISTELKAPLEGIMGAATRLIEDYPNLTTDKVISSARRINESAERLNDFARNLGAA